MKKTVKFCYVTSQAQARAVFAHLSTIFEPHPSSKSDAKGAKTPAVIAIFWGVRFPLQTYMSKKAFERDYPDAVEISTDEAMGLNPPTSFEVNGVKFTHSGNKVEISAPGESTYIMDIARARGVLSTALEPVEGHWKITPTQFEIGCKTFTRDQVLEIRENLLTF